MKHPGHTYRGFVPAISERGMTDDEAHISSMKRQLGEMFMMSNLGPLSYFLGIEVLHSAKGYYLSQSKYIQDLIARSDLTDTQMAITPMDLHL
jgi:hypothetical protein